MILAASQFWPFALGGGGLPQTDGAAGFAAILLALGGSTGGEGPPGETPPLAIAEGGDAAVTPTFDTEPEQDPTLENEVLAGVVANLQPQFALQANPVVAADSSKVITPKTPSLENIAVTELQISPILEPPSPVIEAEVPQVEIIGQRIAQPQENHLDSALLHELAPKKLEVMLPNAVTVNHAPVLNVDSEVVGAKVTPAPTQSRPQQSPSAPESTKFIDAQTTSPNQSPKQDTPPPKSAPTNSDEGAIQDQPSSSIRFNAPLAALGPIRDSMKFAQPKSATETATEETIRTVELVQTEQMVIGTETALSDHADNLFEQEMPEEAEQTHTKRSECDSDSTLTRQTQLHPPLHTVTESDRSSHQARVPSELEAKTIEQVRARIDDIVSLRSGSQITIRLEPAEHGSIEITLKHGGSKVQADFVVSSEPVREMLSSNRSQLADAFAQRGVDLGSMNVSSGTGEHHQNPTTHHVENLRMTNLTAAMQSQTNTKPTNSIQSYWISRGAVDFVI